MMLLKSLLFYFFTVLLALAITLTIPLTDAYWLLLSVLAGFYLANTQIIPQSNPLFLWLGLVVALVLSLVALLLGMVVWQVPLVVALGFLLVGGMRWLFFRSTGARLLRWVFANCLQKAAVLNETIFLVYLARNYSEQIFVYEKKLHWQRNAFLKSLTLVRKALVKFNGASRPAFVKLLQCVEQVYEILLAIGLLGYRVTDHSTFEVANKELLALGDSVSTYLKALAAQLQQGQLAAPTTLTDAIQELQDINHDALQVVAPDPMVFLLFIQDFTVLHKLFIQMIEVIDEAVGS